ncbi:MAG: Pyridoxamine 5-phosphate oxidase [Bacteroidota bacterium]|jgi:hypothetical protein
MNRLKQQLQEVISRNKQPECNWFQIATIDQQGFPCVRTVAFRGFHNDHLLFVSDSRADKVVQLKNNSNVNRK